MPVNIIWSTTENGTQVAEALTGGGTGTNHSSGTNGTELAERELWIRHDGTNPITNVGFYITEFSGPYGGGSTSANDIAELLSWGDGLAGGSPAQATGFGGFQLNMTNIAGVSDPASWPTFAVPQPTNGSAFYTGIGDSSINKVSLSTSMGLAVTSTGVLAGNGATDAQFFTRIKIPTDENTVGIRQFDQKIRYTFTS